MGETGTQVCAQLTWSIFVLQSIFGTKCVIYNVCGKVCGNVVYYRQSTSWVVSQAGAIVHICRIAEYIYSKLCTWVSTVRVHSPLFVHRECASVRKQLIHSTSIQSTYGVLGRVY